MKRVIALFFAFVALVALVAAQDMTIKVGDGGQKFNPATGTTSAGSTITFMWVSGPHSVIQADDGTCNPSAQANAFKVAPQSTGTSTFKVPAGMPKLWFYCGVAQHCAVGNMKLVLTVGGGAGGNATTNSTSGGSTVLMVRKQDAGKWPGRDSPAMSELRLLMIND
ncbi:637_t:CDS:2 [Paraglomus brasilianum]|uniref:637_t:CDS:1 n=1 Tax=Paraglomus brasilianum TaxID=144538 RepID=A0A9N8VV14_9GLOM|nr:637_t:CDS:2 [Paraglomus brasilianum]